MLYARLNNDLRKEYIKKLVKLGFELELEKSAIINSPYPFAVDLFSKIIGCLTTPSYSAVALNQGVILDDDEFIIKVDDFINNINENQ